MSLSLILRFLISLSICILICSVSSAQTATQPSGSGTIADPYLVANLENLYWITQNSSDWDKYYSQTANIDVSSSSGWDSGLGFTPIGNNGTQFTGTYNGGNFSITGLRINRATSDTVGLFGYTDGAAISRLSVTDFDIDADEYVGALIGYANDTDVDSVFTSGTIDGTDRIGGVVGFSFSSSSITHSGTNSTVKGADFVGGLTGQNSTSSTISESYASGDITGTGGRIGGFAGVNFQNSSISNSYFEGTVTGNFRTGGFTGENSVSSSISNVYSFAFVKGDSLAGAFIGVNSTSTISQSYWNSSYGGLSDSLGSDNNSQSVSPLSSLEMDNQSNFTSWNFTSIWTIDEGNSFPVLRDFQQASAPKYLSGSGTALDPFQLSTFNDLFKLSHHTDLWNLHYKQTADINASETSTQDSGKGFSPIGNSSTKFTGNYDGGSFSVSNLNINRDTTDYIGLFGYTDGAAVENLAVTSVSLMGDEYVGALIGYAADTDITNTSSTGIANGNTRVGGLVGHNFFESTIDTSFTTVDVTGTDFVGGLTGQNSSTSSISESYANNVVTGTNRVGGLAGANFNTGTIQNSYFIGVINGTDKVGGLIGENSSSSSVTNSYSYADVNGSTETGAFIGRNSNSTISQSYWNSDYAGISDALGSDDNSQSATGLTRTQMRKQVNFTGWNFSTIWNIDEDTSFPYLRNNEEQNHPGFLIGEGTQADPRQISTWEELVTISGSASLWSLHYIQVADIDASASTSLNSGAGFTPIGTVFNKFTGSYNGSGHSITGLFINNTSTRYVGMFGYTNAATISNLKLINVDITGEELVGGLVGRADNTSVSGVSLTGSVKITTIDDLGWLGGLVGRTESATTISECFTNITMSNVGGQTGGLVGRNLGTITESYSLGTIGLTNSGAVGGLVGENSIGTVLNSYAIVDITATNNFSAVGGLVGRNFRTVTNSYATGFISTINDAAGRGGLIGVEHGASATINSSYWNATVSDQGSSDGGTGRDSGDMKTASKFSGWDFSTIWNIDESLSYPYLRDLEQTPHPTDLKFKGSGTQNDPYLIATFYDLFVLGRNSALFDKFFEQTVDIDGSQGFGSRGLKITSMFNFDGHYDGKNHTISNLTISNGLFGSTSGATIQNIGLVNTTVTGTSNTGGLVGGAQNSTTISNTYVTGSVTASSSNAGGLVGLLIGSSTVTNSYAAASVSASSGAGGLIGSISASTVTSSYWDTLATGLSVSDGGTGLSTTQMQQRSSFSGWDFATTWAIEEGSGYPFFQDNGTSGLMITGDEGWRILSSPVSGTSFTTLLDTIWTQGIAGADTESGSPNIFFWDEPTQSFSAPGNMSEVPGSGVGFLTYIFADDNNDGTNDAFPKVISSPGSQNSGQNSASLSYTDTGNSSNDGWNLIGNPYGSTINWNANSGWGKQNIDNVIYVWSDSASSGSGAYLTWNGLTGTLGNGKIAPWQGFWVKANSSSPAISFSDSIRHTGAHHFKQKSIPEVVLSLDGHHGPSKAIVIFSNLAELGKDPYDAFKLAPLNPDFLSLSTIIDTLDAMDIQALPVEFEEIELEVSILGSNLKDDFELSWKLNSLPETWDLLLIDNQKETEINLRDTSNYIFQFNEDSTKKSLQNEVLSSNIQKPAIPIPITQARKRKIDTPPRFQLKITSTQSVNNETESELPIRVELYQNYPNPFNPSTTISYALPEQTHVQLEVFDLLGRKVMTLVDNEFKSAGLHSVRFEASGLASGVYFYRLAAGNVVSTKNFTLIK